MVPGVELYAGKLEPEHARQRAARNELLLPGRAGPASRTWPPGQMPMSRVSRVRAAADHRALQLVPGGLARPRRLDGASINRLSQSFE